MGDKLARPLFEPFPGEHGIDFLEGFWDGPAVFFAIISFAILHYAIWSAKPAPGSYFAMNKVIGIFRLVFYLGLTSLVILMVIRTAIMTFHDLTRPRFKPEGMILVSPKPNQPSQSERK
jgi:hypothetical protein